MKNVLIIEDDRTLGENIAEILELEGYSVVTARNRDDGYKLAPGQKPDLILCALVKSHADELAFLNQIKNDKTTSEIPIVFLSGDSIPLQAREVRPYAEKYLSKTFVVENLLAGIELNCINGSMKVK